MRLKEYCVRKIPTAAVVLLICIALQGCSLPRSGPMLGEVEESHERGNIVLIPVTPQLAANSREADHASFPEAFLTAGDADVTRLVPGDGVKISFWEKDGLQLFVPDANGMTDLGELTLDNEGNIYLPYIGKVRAQDLTPGELHDVIVQHLRRIVIASEVSVQATSKNGQIVIVQGELSKPGVYPLNQSTHRLSGLLAQAAPEQRNPEQTAVTIQRRGQLGTVRLADIYHHPAQNIALHPGDVVIVHSVLQYFTVLGAANGQRRLPLSKRNYSVADALADANGLSDNQANPYAVFLMRTTDSTYQGQAGDVKPVVYRFDFTQPEQLLLAGQFTVQEGDGIYIANSPFTQLQKVLSVFSSGLGSARSGTTLAK